MRVLLALFLTTGLCFGAACITTAPGNWSSAATWASCGGGVPGNGDTATQTHAVTVDVDTTVGTSPSDSTTIVFTNGANLTIAAGVTFTVRGNVVFNYDISMLAGSKIVADPTQASTRPSAAYIWGPEASHPWGSLTGTACTSVARCEIKTLRSNGDEARARFSDNGQYYNFNRFDVRYMDFTDLGSASLASIYFMLRYNDAQALTFDIRNSTFTRCGPIEGVFYGGDDYFRHINNVWTGSLMNFNLGGGQAGITTGETTITGNFFDKSLGDGGLWANPYGVGATVTDNVIAGLGTFANWATFARNVVFQENAGTTDTGFRNSMTDVFIINESTSNPHFFASNVVEDGVVLDGMILEAAGVGAIDGDGFVFGSLVDPVTGTIKNSLFLPTVLGNSATILSWATSTASKYLNATHNTTAGSTNWNHGLFINECVGACTPAGMILEYKSNLMWANAPLVPLWNPPVGPGANHIMYQGTPNDNVLADGVATNNTCWNCAVATVGGPANGTMYNVPLSVGQTVPGTNDLNVNPGMADPANRNIEQWAVTKGQAATIAGAKVALATSPTTMIADLFNYIRQGYAPTNLALATAAHDGTWIGAVKPVLMFGFMNQ